MYEVFSISGHYVLHDGSKSLWCSKLDGAIIPSNSTILDEHLDPVCQGTCKGIVGKIQFLPDSPENLVLISDTKFICKLHGHDVYRVEDIVMLPLSLETPYLDLPKCPDHAKPPKGENVTETDAKIERKLEEEFVKWFEKSFYFSDGGDLTHSLTELSTLPLPDATLPPWRRAKTEYFWNEHMLQCLMKDEQSPIDLEPWIIPVMQGYIEQTVVPVPASPACTLSAPSDIPGDLTMTIISRRNKYRAGTRFKRRGIDDDGCPANFVETEQILQWGSDEMSYTIIRGSVPLYWYQPLTNYRPKPVILKPPEEALVPFKVHMDGLVERYSRIIVVNLLDSEGKEAPLGTEYAKVAYMYNNENLTYIAFDFNDYCAGMKFDNVSMLLSILENKTKSVGYTHLRGGVVRRRQEGVIRVNCMDSLDRTNVVQGAITKQSRLAQVQVLGLEDSHLSGPGKLLWANSGDAISTQYAGTAALKGDYTRTGERGVAGMMRDGVSSVTRMYINIFRDTNRQAAIDIMQGLEPDLAEIRDEKSEELDCVPALLEAGQDLLPSEEDTKTHNITKSWVVQEWGSSEAKCVWLSSKSLSVVGQTGEVMESLPLSTCDRLHIGQPPDCLGHYIRLINGKFSITVRPLVAQTSQLKDILMKMAHSIVNSRDDLGLTTQVLHGPLTKSADIVDFDRIRNSANQFGTRIAAGAKRMIGEARGVLDTGPSASSISPKTSPKFGKKMFNIFKRDQETGPVLPPVRLSDISNDDSIETVTDGVVTSLQDNVTSSPYHVTSPDEDNVTASARVVSPPCVIIRDRSPSFSSVESLTVSKSQFIFFDKLLSDPTSSS